MSILYLHGFASSPQSRKARFFADKLREIGMAIDIPDLAAGNFEHLTVSGQLQLIEQLNSHSNRKQIVIGSSLGGYLAALFAARHPEQVDRLLLLAPAFGFYELWKSRLGPERIAEWERKGSLPVFHYGAGQEMPLRYEFLEDAARYEPFPDARQPVLIFHGEHDPVVPIEQSLAFTRLHPTALLTRCSSGHELTDVLESIWYESKPFLMRKD